MMKIGQNRFKKPDIVLVLAVVVGLGALVSTSVQADERPAAVPTALMVSYQGALPAFRQRLAEITEQASGLVQQAQILVPGAGVAKLMMASPSAPEQMYLAFEAPESPPEVLKLHPENGFEVEAGFVPTLVFQRRW